MKYGRIKSTLRKLEHLKLKYCDYPEGENKTVYMKTIDSMVDYLKALDIQSISLARFDIISGCSNSAQTIYREVVYFTCISLGI